MKPISADATPDHGEPGAPLLGMLHGYRATCVVVAALRLGILDRLATGALELTELARLVGAPTPALSRLVRALVLLGLVQTQDDRVELSPLGGLLASRAHVWRDLALLTAEEYLPAWADLAHGVRTGSCAFDHVFGASAWEHRRDHPELNAAFNRLMAAAQAEDGRALVETYDFSGVTALVDVGGGRGHLLATVLGRHPMVRGVLFDQPHVVGEAPGILRAAGIADRCRTVAGSFFASVPTGGDTYVLQNILHDWDDAQCMSILRNCRQAMGDGDTLLVIEGILPEAAAADSHLVMLDLHMMAVLGGQERMRQEYDDLLVTAGFAPAAPRPLRGSTALIAAKAV